MLYWRTAGGAEVDFVIEQGNRLLPIEIKTASTVNTKDVAAVSLFLQEYGAQVPGALLLYGGARTFWVAPRVLATPWWKVI